jgi:hypothetical protein
MSLRVTLLFGSMLLSIGAIIHCASVRGCAPRVRNLRTCKRITAVTVSVQPACTLSHPYDESRESRNLSSLCGVSNSFTYGAKLSDEPYT